MGTFIKEKQMNILLANNERLIKDWDYAYGKGGNGKFHAYLTVTSKRIVSMITAKRFSSYQEVPLRAVKSIECSQNKKSNILPILGIIIGIPLIPVIVGILLIISCVKKLNQGEFSLSITTDGLEYPSLEIGALKNKGKGFFGRLLSVFKRNKYKVNINFATASEICETIGAVILEHKQAA